MKKKLLYICMVFALAGAAQADTLLLTTSGTGGTREQRVTLTPGTTLTVSGSGTVQVLSTADFKSAIGLATVASSGALTDMTGTLPGANVQVSGTGNAGVVTQATDGEVQTGAGIKNVVVSSLAAWWGWVKTQSQTIAGNWSWTGNTTMGDAAGDSHTINAGTLSAPNATSTASGNNLINLTAQDARYSRQTYYAIATTNTDAFASTTYVTVATLSGVEVGDYQLELAANIQVFGGSAGGGKIQVIGGTATIVGKPGWAIKNDVTLANALDVTASIGYTWSGYQAILSRRGVLSVTVAGTILVQFAQNSSDALGNRYAAGSWVILRKL